MHQFSHYHLAEKANIITASVPGIRSQELLKLQEEIEGSVVSYPKNFPIAIRRAKGAIIEDVDGNQFLDFFAGAGVLNLGHCNQEILPYVESQQQDLIHALDFPTENKMRAIQNILSELPEKLRDRYKVSFGGPTGSDAIEAAIKLAKIKTGREGIIAFAGGYHGMSAGALAVTSDVNFRKKIWSLMPNVHFLPFNYCYRCPFSQHKGKCNYSCAAYLRDVIENQHSGVNKPAAILLEPIQGEGGNIPASKRYLQEVIQIARDHDILVIFDEIQSGFYRSGEFLAFMESGVEPDIITISKGIGGLGFPLSGLIYKKEIEAWGPGAHIGTFRGNQVSLAAANGAFDFVRRHKVQEYVKEISTYLMESLQELVGICPFIGEIRGRGLMIGIEFVKDKHTKKPYAAFVNNFKTNCFQRGLLFEVGGHHGNVARLVPPLIITPKIVDAAIEIMKKGLKQTMRNAKVASFELSGTFSK
ncbi:MAG: aspartate aminotransferase family protein [Saprospiraceae bacterium]|nr:aspartate aminotransferase family protein [Saprospiraceae bacterium]